MVCAVAGSAIPIIPAAASARIIFFISSLLHQALAGSQAHGGETNRAMRLLSAHRCLGSACRLGPMKRAASKSRPSCESPAFAGITLCSPDGLLGLLQLDGSAGVLDLLLDLLRLILVDAFLDGLGRAFDQRLGFAQTQAGDRADFLDHVDLLAAVAGQDHVELG